MHVLYLIQEYYVKSNTEEEHLDIALVSEYQIPANNRFLKTIYWSFMVFEILSTLLELRM